MESVFSRFESYDFTADRRFQDGLKSFHGCEDETKLLDIKLFFYNRFVEPIDQGSYRQWSSASHRVTQTDCERPDQPSRSDSGVSNNLTSQTSAETQAMPLSFVEVMRLVQEGKEVPGVTKVDVEPTNQSPTPSRMERMLKPWEISVSK